MVEMLGVLAIIGVLSVGAIAGYAQAMEMYKENQWKNNFSWLISNVKNYYITSGQFAEIDYTATKKVVLNTFLKKTDVIPDNFFVHSTTSADIDYMYNTIEISNKYKAPWGSRFTFRVTTKQGDTSVKTCNLLYEMAYQYSGLWYVGVDGIAKGTGYCSSLAPETFWTYNQCRSFPVSLADVSTTCTTYCTNSCTIILMFDNTVI